MKVAVNLAVVNYSIVLKTCVVQIFRTLFSGEESCLRSPGLEAKLYIGNLSKPKQTTACTELEFVD